MNKRISLTIILLFSILWVKGQTCSNDTIFSDVIFLVDNSGSIDDAEFAEFSSIILATVNKVKSDCPEARIGVVHYGGFEGKETMIEHTLSNSPVATIDRQFCTSRNMFNLCVGGGGDDLNNAIGDIMTYISNGTLNHGTENELNLVIFTDAFGFDTTCPQPNCSLILPTTNIDAMKATYETDVTVVGVSSQAEEALLGIYASPGGTFNGPLWAAECAGSYDGCVTPRKYLQIEFDDDVNTASDNIASFVACEFQIVAGMMVEAGNMQMVCGDLSQSASLTAVGSVGVPPYSYSWSNGDNGATISVTPSVNTTYYVTATDAINCSHVDSVLVKAENCCSTFTVDAGLDSAICGNLSESTTLSATSTGSSMSVSYVWNNGLGAGASHVVSPAVTTTYTVTATDNIGCMDIDAVTVTVNLCCSGFSVSLGPDQNICGDIPESTTITAIPSGGTGPYTYTWDNGLADQASHIVMPAFSTTYSVTITDGAGCMATDQVNIIVDICGPDCAPDTTFTDVIFLVDNSGSIDDAEFAEFKSIIEGSITGICSTCPSSKRGVVHYGGVNGQSTMIEYPLGSADETSTLNRQFCTSRFPNGICIGGGGDDLNHAIGDIMMYIDNGMLSRNPANQLSLIIFTDAFSFDTSCGQPNCSLILPTTNIDLMKANYGVDVSVIGVSSQAEETLLGIYASPGGSFNGPLWPAECPGSFDGCVTPRKYVQIEFDTPPTDVADMITNFVFCSIDIQPALVVDAGPDVSICGNFGESTTLTAVPSLGTFPYLYMWSDSAASTTKSITVSPTVTTTYYVTATDVNNCTDIDSVTVNVLICDDCEAEAGTPKPPMETCMINGQALLPTQVNDGVVVPSGFEIVYLLTNSDLTIIDYSIGSNIFLVREEGLYRVHTLIAEVTNPGSDDYLDLNIIKIGISNLFIVGNCIIDHDICADLDYPGRVHQVFGPTHMMCMTVENTINLCWDGRDNDGDGLVDCADPDCQAFIVCKENTVIACNDLTDNDLDGLVDCFDPDCFEFTLCFERGDQCKDGIDNDGDGLVDCDDPSCTDSPWCAEDSPFTCVDGIDNDRDGLIDCQEASCQMFMVCAEYSESACQDGIDNDFDGLIDCADGGCKEVLGVLCDPTENNMDKCNDGIDNDGDGLIDCADPDCMTQQLIDVGDNVNIVIEVDNATCPDNDNGAIRFVGLAQNVDFHYSIDGGLTYYTVYEFTGLSVGPYNVVIKSINGCLLTVSVDVTGLSCQEICHNGVDDNADGLVDCDDNQCKNQPNPHNIQIVNIQGADCPGYSNGFFSIANMPQNMRFSIDGFHYQTLPQFSSLTDGTYNLYYKDAHGCYGPIQVVIPKATFDSDGDGVCDGVDKCPGVNDALIGTTCDDGDPCTLNDTYNSTCGCIGVYTDTDSDGVCDAEDQCPGQNDQMIGMACDDGDPCTINDTNDGSCNCIGTYVDADNDGVCDALDQCPNVNDSIIGMPCDDGNACTADDAYSTACECVGVFQDADFDGVCDAEDQCPGVSDLLVGTSCDDGDACTINDVFDSACNCIGTFQDTDGDTVCDAEDVCPSGDDTLRGTACDDGNPCTINDIYTVACNCVGQYQDTDGDGVCDAEDVCPSGDDTLIGLPCDDGNPCTINDLYTSVCTCLGLYVDSDGDGVCDAEDVCPSGDDTLQGAPCDDGNPCTINDTYTIACNCEGLYQDSDGDGVCDAEDVCPSGDDTLIGLPCDDGNPCTINDFYTSACTCLGLYADSDGDGVCDAEDICPNSNDNLIGTPCDDGNNCTVDDTYSQNCECIGIYKDTDLDGVCDWEDKCPGQNDANCWEECDNGIDDDGDGLVDCDDGDCVNDSLCAPPVGSIAVGPSIEVSVMLQGARNPVTGHMNTALNDGGYLPGQEPITFFGNATPAGQPFNQAPWFYEGDEGKNLKSGSLDDQPLYDPEVVDWVLISLRTDPEKPSEVWRAAALLYNDGTVELFRPLDIENIEKDGYFVVVEHRNHLPVMSHKKVKVIDGSLIYDFMQQDSYNSILGVGQMQDDYGMYMMVAGNGELIVELSSDIDINARDLTIWLQNNGANSSYFLEDYDMNGDINIKDRILWEKNNGLFTTLKTK